MKRNWKIITLVMLTVLAPATCDNKDNTPANGGENNTAASQTEEREDVKGSRLITITSVNDSGFMDYLRQSLLDDTSIEMEIVSKESGTATEDGRQGNANIILAYPPKAEKKFIDEGFSTDRTSLMYSYFVIVEPKDDLIKIAGKQTEETFRLTNDTKAPFASRRNESGAHKKELTIWEKVGLNPKDLKANRNYNSPEDGMGTTLKFANEKQGYALTDLATSLSMGKDLSLKVLVDQSEVLKNVYSIILINPDKVGGVNTELVKELQDWMISEKIAQLIDKYGVEEYGQQLPVSGE